MKQTLAPLPQATIVDPQSILDLYRSGALDQVCVLGPTASGKTRYAVALAAAIGAEIISADSRQVYRGMDIGTGKDLADYGDVPYHLIDIAEPSEQYNVFRFKEDFERVREEIVGRCNIPLICGGTGLYINAVTAGYGFEGQKSALSSSAGADYSRTFFIGTLVDRQTRNARIDARLDARLQEGMVDEIKGLLSSGVSADALKAYGLEYRYVTEYVLGETSYEYMREHLAIAIHQFAKRQMTWLRGMERAGAVIHWVEV